MFRLGSSRLRGEKAFGAQKKPYTSKSARLLGVFFNKYSLVKKISSISY